MRQRIAAGERDVACDLRHMVPRADAQIERSGMRVDDVGARRRVAVDRVRFTGAVVEHQMRGECLATCRVRDTPRDRSDRARFGDLEERRVRRA